MKQSINNEPNKNENKQPRQPISPSYIIKWIVFFIVIILCFFMLWNSMSLFGSSSSSSVSSTIANFFRNLL